MQLEDGYLLVLPRDQAKVFFGKKEDRERLDFLTELLNDDSSVKLGCDGKWQLLHDTLTGLRIQDSVLAQCILGGRPMQQGDDYHVCLVRPDVVRFIVDQGEQIDESRMETDVLRQVRAVLNIYRQAADVAGAVLFIAKRN